MTFTELYNIVKPDEGMDSWSQNERKRVMHLVKKNAPMDDILKAMDLFPTDWSKARKAEMKEEMCLFIHVCHVCSV